MKDYKELINDLRELIEAPNDNAFIFNAKALMKNVADALEDDGWLKPPSPIQPPVGKAVLFTTESPNGKREVETGIVRKLGEKPYIYERGGYLQTGRIVTWREMPEPYTGE